MTEEKVQKINDCFETHIEDCRNAYERLLKDDRTDEAVFEKIKGNVYDIFRTVLWAAVKAGKNDDQAVRAFFYRKAEQIPSNWKASYEKAKAHKNIETMEIERIKLETIGEIKEIFAKIWEGVQ